MLILLGTSCSKGVIWAPESPEGEGSLTIALSADGSHVGSKAEGEAEGSLNLDDFRIAIYKTENQMRLYNDSYANTSGKTLKFNAGEYRLVAQLGDTLGCGFDKPYFMADPTFTIERGNNTVEATAKLANVKLAINFDSTISEVYPDYYAIVKHNTIKGKEVKFVKGETRPGYIPGGDLVLEVYANIDGTWKYYKTAPASYEPNDFVTFSITTNAAEGSLSISITVDKTVDQKDQIIEVPATALPQEGPSITLAGFESAGNVHEFVEGMNAQGHNASANFIAKAGIAHCYLTMKSDYLAGKGVSGTVDFANLSTDAATALRSAGFEWDYNMFESRTFSFIDLSNLIKNIMAETKAEKTDKEIARFSLRVVDGVGKEITGEFSIVSRGVSLSLEIKDYMMWARKIESPAVTITNGVPELVTLQSSVDGVNWSELATGAAGSGNSIFFGKVPCNPSSTFHVRAIYNGDASHASNAVTVTSEAVAQVGNSGFEDWKVTGWRTTSLYEPFSSEADQWWDVNSKASMPDQNYSTYSNFKCMPTVTYSNNNIHSGSASAQVSTINIGWANSTAATTGDWFVGELFIGDADSDGNKVSSGHAFSSRPSAISFWYQFEAYKDSDRFGVDASISDKDGNVIATASITDGPLSDTWQKMTIPLSYSNGKVKAASIYISFKASTSSSHSCSNGGSWIEIAGTTGSGDKQRIKLSSMLRVDDIELIYE